MFVFSCSSSTDKANGGSPDDPDTGADLGPADFPLASLEGEHDWAMGSVDLGDEGWMLHGFMFKMESGSSGSSLQSRLPTDPVTVDIVERNDHDQFAIGITVDSADLFSPAGEKWVKLAWTEKDGTPLMCFTSFYGTQSGAEGASADPSNLTAGCKGGVWWELRPRSEVAGVFQDVRYDWSQTYVNAFQWAEKRSGRHFESCGIIEMNLEDQYLIGVNDQSLDFCRIEWIQGDEGEWHYCEIDGWETRQQAESAQWDPSDLDDGCVYPDGSRGSWRTMRVE